MWKTIARRLLILIPQLIALSLIVFILAQGMPGDALTGRIDPNTRPERLEELRQQWGFYDPWYVKYVKWIGNAVQGDFGVSISYQMPVTSLILDRAANTFWLGLLTVVLTYLIAVPLGIISGRFHDRLADRAITMYSYLALAMPSIVMGLFLMLAFAFGLKLFPWQGSVTTTAIAAGGITEILDRLHHLVLPALSGALISTTTIIQFLRSEIVDYEQSDFVTTARSKGVPRRVIYSRHIFRNSMIPVASFMGFSISGVLSGSILLETLFGYPGMGQLFITSIQQRDSSVSIALIMFFAVLTVLGSLLSDIIMYIVDPRLKIK